MRTKEFLETNYEMQNLANKTLYHIMNEIDRQNKTRHIQN